MCRECKMRLIASFSARHFHCILIGVELLKDSQEDKCHNTSSDDVLQNQLHKKQTYLVRPKQKEKQNVL